jgi:hypothetical protein
MTFNNMRMTLRFDLQTWFLCKHIIIMFNTVIFKSIQEWQNCWPEMTIKALLWKRDVMTFNVNVWPWLLSKRPHCGNSILSWQAKLCKVIVRLTLTYKCMLHLHVSHIYAKSFPNPSMCNKVMDQTKNGQTDQLGFALKINKVINVEAFRLQRSTSLPLSLLALSFKESMTQAVWK